jgi:hypothetical protein
MHLRVFLAPSLFLFDAHCVWTVGVAEIYGQARRRAVMEADHTLTLASGRNHEMCPPPATPASPRRPRLTPKQTGRSLRSL